MLQVNAAIHAAFGRRCPEPDPGARAITRAIAQSAREFKTGRYEP